MIRGIYTAASGMQNAEMQMDTLANNLANVNTVGFKKNGVNFQAFPEMMMKRLDAQGVHDVGQLMSGSKVRSTAVNFNQGNIRQTGNTLDVAIQGDGFFMVQDPESKEMSYTRNGEFIVDAQGYLTTIDGHWVMSQRANEQESPLVIPYDAKKIEIANGGSVTVNGQQVGNIKVAVFDNPQTLEKFKENLYKTTEASTQKVFRYAYENPGYQLFQGNLELSNVNVVAEMVNNITGMRLYESLQKNIQMQNQTLEKAVNDVGRYKA